MHFDVTGMIQSGGLLLIALIVVKKPNKKVMLREINF